MLVSKKPTICTPCPRHLCFSQEEPCWVIWIHQFQTHFFHMVANQIIWESAIVRHEVNRPSSAFCYPEASILWHTTFELIYSCISLKCIPKNWPESMDRLIHRSVWLIQLLAAAWWGWAGLRSGKAGGLEKTAILLTSNCL